MANYNASKKSIRQTAKRRLINKNRKSRIKTFIKKFYSALEQCKQSNISNTTELNAIFSGAQSEIMRGAKSGILKLNNASRKVSAMANAIKKTITKL